MSADPVVAAIVAEVKPDDGGAGRQSASTLLVEIARERFEFGMSDAGEPFAVPKSGPKVVSTLRGGRTSLRALLAREYFQRVERAPAQQALADALLVIEGIAQDEDESRLDVRVAAHGGALWLDLGNHSGRAVRIDSEGWEVVDSAPVLFRRSALNAPLPEPVEGGDLVELWQWLNVSEEDRPLIAAWIVAALYPNVPHPVLDLSGEQGSGKTTAQKVIVSTIDPSPVPTRKPPRDPESWVTATSGSWLVGLDNLSTISDWLSDSLCRAVTGDGDVRRKLYKDSDLIVFSFRRCVIITGIDLGAINGDLSDRLLPIHLDLIASDHRLEEGELWPRWNDAHPRILGAILTMAASVARVLPSVRLDSKPRMADFARIVAAVDKVLGTNGLARYLDKQGALATESLTGDAFAMALQEKLNTSFEGTSAELLALIPAQERTPRDWPTDARRVTQRLNRQAPVMRKAGWSIENDKGANKTHAVRWTITHLFVRWSVIHPRLTRLTRRSRWSRYNRCDRHPCPPRHLRRRPRQGRTAHTRPTKRVSRQICRAWRVSRATNTGHLKTTRTCSASSTMGQTKRPRNVGTRSTTNCDARSSHSTNGRVSAIHQPCRARQTHSLLTQ